MSNDILNSIGSRGENITATRLTEFHIFRECFLGEKYPAADFLFDIVDNKTPYPFLVQVKSTHQRSKYTDDKKAIKTPIPKSKLGKLIDRPLPTYVAGVDEDKEIVYLVSAFDRNANYTSSIPTKIKFKKGNKRNKKYLERLKDDVIKYWEGINADVKSYKDTFKSDL